MVIYDALVSPAILIMINPQAENINVGNWRGRHSLIQSETSQLLIDKAQIHAIVVCLKGGDPFIFACGGEHNFLFSTCTTSFCSSHLSAFDFDRW